MDNAELLKAIIGQFDKLSMQVNDMEYRFSERLNRIEQQQSRFNQRFDNVDQQIQELKQDFSELKQSKNNISDDDDDDMEIVIFEHIKNFTQSEELIENISSSASFTIIDKIVQNFSTIEVIEQNKISKSFFPVEHNKTMVIIAMIIQLGARQFSHLIPIVISVAESIWGYNTFKIFDPGGKQNFLRALVKIEYVQSYFMRGALSFLEYIQSHIQEREREERGSVALQLSATRIL